MCSNCPFFANHHFFFKRRKLRPKSENYIVLVTKLNFGKLYNFTTFITYHNKNQTFQSSNYCRSSSRLRFFLSCRSLQSLHGALSIALHYILAICVHPFIGHQTFTAKLCQTITFGASFPFPYIIRFVSKQSALAERIIDRSHGDKIFERHAFYSELFCFVLGFRKRLLQSSGIEVGFDIGVQ